MRTTIEMAREAAGDDWGLFQEYMPEIHRLVELVRADERNRTWTQEHWTEYERSIVEAEREAISNEIIEDLHALYDTEMIKEEDSGDALIRLDEALAVVEEAIKTRRTHD